MWQWRAVFGLISLMGLTSVWHHTHIDYDRYPPTVRITGAARDTLNAAYAAYQHQDSTAPFIEHGFCARSWVTSHPAKDSTVVEITSVVRSEVNATPISVGIPCSQPGKNAIGIVFHTHPPQQCVIKSNWEAWSDCKPSTDLATECRPSYMDLADTLEHRGVPARFLVCGEDHFVLYHATDAL